MPKAKVTPDNKEPVIVRLDSQHPEANASAVSSSISAVLALVRQTHIALGSNEELLIKARPFADGSFEIPLELIVVGVGALLVNPPLLGSLLDAVGKYFEVKQALKGDTAKQKDDRTIIVKGIEMNVGSVVVNLLAPESSADQEVARALQELDIDESISGIELIRGKERAVIASVPKSDFRFFKQPSLEDRAEERRQKRSRETLGIASPVLDGKAMWRFTRGGIFITASIDDSGFIERVQKRAVTFAAGDRLEVDLVIDQVYDPGVGDYINKTYTVERVWHHERAKTQRNLRYGED